MARDVARRLLRRLARRLLSPSTWLLGSLVAETALLVAFRPVQLPFAVGARVPRG